MYIPVDPRWSDGHMYSYVEQGPVQWHTDSDKDCVTTTIICGHRQVLRLNTPMWLQKWERESRESELQWVCSEGESLNAHTRSSLLHIVCLSLLDTAEQLGNPCTGTTTTFLSLSLLLLTTCP